jgi:hypothetical protein
MATETVVAPKTEVSTLPAIKHPIKMHIAPIIQNDIDLGSAMNMSFVFSYLNLTVLNRLKIKIFFAGDRLGSYRFPVSTNPVYG